MKVEATKQGFVGPGEMGRLVNPGDEFEIPDEPSRDIDKKKDDKLTQSIAKSGKVPVAWSSAWMKPADEKQKEKPPESKRTGKDGKTLKAGHGDEEVI